MKKRAINRKGELSIDQIIAIILALMAFAIILFVVITKVDWSGSTGDKACTLSALERATIPTVLGAQNFVELKCRTKIKCISDGAGKCDNYFKGETGVDYIAIPKITEKSDDASVQKAARAIEKTYVESMYNCWTMLGEGNLWIFPQSAFERYGWKEGGFNCIVCDRIAIDDKTFENLGLKEVMQQVDFNRYMRDTAVPGKQYSYLQAMTNKGVNAFPSVNKEVFQKTLDANNKNSYTKTTPLVADGVGTQKAIVFSQLKINGPEKALGNLGSDAAVIAGGAFVVSRLPVVSAVVNNGLGWVIRAASAKVLVISAVVTVAVVGVTVGGTALVAYENQNLAAGRCGTATSADKDKVQNGCSLVQSVAYSDDIINGLCTNTEGLG